MKRTQHRIRIKVDGYTRFCLTAIMVLLTVMVVGLWADGMPSAREAGAQGTLPPQQQQMRYQPRSTIDIGEMVGLQTQTNDKLEEIRKLLESGNVKVQVVESAAPAKQTGGNSNGPVKIEIIPNQ